LRAIPSLREIERMCSVPDERVVLRDVDWSFYEQLIDSLPKESHIHVDYDGKDLELVSPKSLLHDRRKTLLGQLVTAVAQELSIPYMGLGETTWTRREVRRGLEPDEAYYFQPEKLAAAAKHWRGNQGRRRLSGSRPRHRD
jgi:Uma2 family endonuclease